MNPEKQKLQSEKNLLNDRIKNLQKVQREIFYSRYFNITDITIKRIILEAIDEAIEGALQKITKECLVIQEKIQTKEKTTEPYEVLAALFKAKSEGKKLQKLYKFPSGIYETKAETMFMDTDENPTVETYNLFRIKP